VPDGLGCIGSEGEVGMAQLGGRYICGGWWSGGGVCVPRSQSCSAMAGVTRSLCATCGGLAVVAAAR